MLETKTNKIELINEIKHLISADGTSVDINPNYLEYFELDELTEIKNQLLLKKQNQTQSTTEYLNDIYDKCIL